MKTMPKRAAMWLLMAGLVAMMLCPIVGAQDYIDTSKEGSISVAMKTSDGTAVGGGTLDLYQVADIQTGDNGQAYYNYTQAFSGVDADLDDVADSSFADAVSAWAADNNVAPISTAVVGENGIASFPNLALGVYLVVETQAAEGYNVISPFVVTVPFYEDGILIYDVDAAPKVEPITESESTPPADTPPSPSEPEIPQTGAILWPIFLIGGIGVALLGVGACFVIAGRKKKVIA